MVAREERSQARVEARMKTLSLLLLALAGVGCTSPGPSERPPEHAAEVGAMSVIPLQFAVATEVASALSRLQPDARVVADQRTNSVLVACATEGELSQLRDCIAKLDVRVQGAN